MRYIFTTTLVSLILALSLIGQPAAAAQTSPAQPVNLSRSGTAAYPRLVTLPDGRMQAFWFDRFDGIMTAVYDGSAWSEPKRTSLRLKNETGIPETLLASANWIYAFWLELETGNTNGAVLKFSSIIFGKTNWAPPETLAHAVLAYDITTTMDGQMLTYIQGQHLSGGTAGVYIRLSEGAYAGFGAAQQVYEDAYLRTLAFDQAYVQAVVAQEGSAGEPPEEKIYLGWTNPRSGGVVIGHTQDFGRTWSGVTQVDPPAQGEPFAKARLHFSIEMDSLMLLWKASSENSCTAYLQTSAAGQADISFNAASKIAQPLPACPQNDLIWDSPYGTLWLWGQGSAALGLMRWDFQAQNGLEPIELSYQVQEDGRPEPEMLDDLQFNLMDDRLIVVGRSAGIQDIWFTSTELEPLVAAEPEPSAWAAPLRTAVGDASIHHLNLALDQAGRAHVVWSHRSRADAQGASIYYIQTSGGKISRSMEIVQPEQANYDPQLSLAVDVAPNAQNDMLHLVWTGPAGRGILYSHTLAREALTMNSWSEPVTIAAGGSASAAEPQLLVTPDHRLYVLYSIPLNEGRGIYMVASVDGGRSWSKPAQVFDAAQAGWQMVDHPSLAVSPDGILHAAWVKRPLPGMGQPEGIYYARSFDGGNTWEDPGRASEAGYDWPALAAAQNQINLVYLHALTGGLFQRIIDLRASAEDTPPRWSVAVKILNDRAQAAADSPNRPFSMAALSNSLYLTAFEQGANGLFYSARDGGPLGDTRWSTGEGIATPQENTGQALSNKPCAVAVLPGSDTLVVGYLQAAKSDAEAPGIELVIRSRSITAEEPVQVASRSGALDPSVMASATAEGSLQFAVASTPLATATRQALPTATATFSNVEDRSLPVLPPILGIFLAAATIVMAMLLRILWLREHA